MSKIESQTDSEDQTLETHVLSNIKRIPDDFLNVLTQITLKKYLIKLTLVFSKDYKLEIIALFDTGADLNCIKERVVPKRFLQTTSERLFVINNSKLHLLGKTQESILNNGFYIKNFFVVTNDINHTIILGTPFIDISTHYKTKHNCIISKINGVRLVFPFLER